MSYFYFFSLFVMLLSVFFGLMSSSWFYLWIMLELNTLSYVGMLFCFPGGSFLAEGGLKYFLVQSFSSVCFLFFFLSSDFFYGVGFLSLSDLMMVSSLLLKLGLFPFHHWFPFVSLFLDWRFIFLLFTVQKLLPFWILPGMVSVSLLLFLSISGILFSVMSQGAHSNLRLFMTFSSISHSVWIFFSVFLSLWIFLFYYFFYSLMTLAMSLYFWVINVGDSLGYFGGVGLYFWLFSLAGLPPFIGFFSKWLVLSGIVVGFGLGVFYFFGILAVYSFYFYLRYFYGRLIIFELSSFTFSSGRFKLGFVSIFFLFFLFFSAFF